MPRRPSTHQRLHVYYCGISGILTHTCGIFIGTSRNSQTAEVQTHGRISPRSLPGAGLPPTPSATTTRASSCDKRVTTAVGTTVRAPTCGDAVAPAMVMEQVAPEPKYADVLTPTSEPALQWTVVAHSNGNRIKAVPVVPPSPDPLSSMHDENLSKPKPHPAGLHDVVQHYNERREARASARARRRAAAAAAANSVATQHNVSNHAHHAAAVGASYLIPPKETTDEECCGERGLASTDEKLHRRRAARQGKEDIRTAAARDTPPMTPPMSTSSGVMSYARVCARVLEPSVQSSQPSARVRPYHRPSR